jgi:hypothetical protein
MHERSAEPPRGTRRARGLEAHRVAMAKRRAYFRQLHDFSHGRGLEIGPLDSAIATPEVADVRYVDVQDTPATRAHYAHDPAVLVDLIPQIHFTLDDGGGRIRSLVEAAGSEAPYDWVIASHVIEHVPDVVAWLNDVAELVIDNGTLVLAVPDRRYCFDVHRPPTTTGQMLAAHEAGDTRPSIRAVYDYLRSAVSVDPAMLRRGLRPPGRSARIHELATIQERMDRARSGEYIDSHVWTLTPDELVDHVRDLRELDLCCWYVETVHDLGVGTEFQVVFRRLPRAMRPSNAEVQEPFARLELPGWLDDAATLRDRVRTLERQLRRSRARNETLKQRLSALEGSVRMRVGSILVSPLATVWRTYRRVVGENASPSQLSM